ncbi:hypothetical protein H0A61_01960 [Koleobacter methoxysyntrophicus]|uniref:Uncharacterized protein n=1 Tax=Koleobacter methoxysyntrophicus TaxID=2751313 RepID=A0A8A0RME5_9FIRM|nr:hypothetical protein [Koleobacter methoxysyntrophicus]QSQ09585.1 hypothetical protein H0A61_01960 [Koleobacter methoxysyntrophicus]
MLNKKNVSLLVIVCLLMIINCNLAFADNGNLIKPNDAGGYWEYWKVVEVGSQYWTYSSWEIGASGTGYKGDSIAYGEQKSWSSTYSGTLKCSKNEIEASVGYSFTNSGSQWASYTAYFEYDGQYIEIQVRSVYKTKSVKQQKWIHNDGYDVPTGEYAYVYPKGWDHWDYRAVKY